MCYLLDFIYFEFNFVTEIEVLRVDGVMSGAAQGIGRRRLQVLSKLFNFSLHEGPERHMPWTFWSALPEDCLFMRFFMVCAPECPLIGRCRPVTANYLKQQRIQQQCFPTR
jgi:hypothetical protein